MEGSGKISIDLKRDMEEIGKIIYDYFESTYIDQVLEHINSFKKSNEENPIKEVKFINALAPFMEDEIKNKALEFNRHIINSQTVSQLIDVYTKNNNTKLDRDENTNKNYLKQIMCGILLYKIILTLEEYNKI